MIEVVRGRAEVRCRHEGERHLPSREEQKRPALFGDRAKRHRNAAATRTWSSLDEPQAQIELSDVDLDRGDGGTRRSITASSTMSISTVTSRSIMTTA